ncbi:dipeptide/oligopeptide/nickel ABC transporter permease/ATP-binding protein [Pengzhenrongella frigida]|uniref:Dipeptide/oligopeptide/nickel ABC transporter permease/ATP-binding protein n=1 Tax=Pengzhenrongella frigida TaxID=1259133 RepID=A0A4Q5MYB9_9MICO|nr:dipeptide/oligopeptide/nickel ABC transporter permease/ATP-binding protein [Cellulomonas sp. HLT2-17]RYV50792.1 dipeptide/oligopeptide/nickel ABC transporter permease/ATP-binding protein [Cellulomonas sp. HLT2-17]
MTLPSPDGTAGVAPDAAALVGVALPKRAHLVRRLLKDPTAVVSIVLLIVIAAASFAAPLLTSADPAAPSLANTLGPPAPGHPLGFDGVGRDIFARLLYGGQVSLIGALIAVLVAVAIGVPSGLLAGYAKGAFDAVASWTANLTMAIPAIVILLVVMTALGASTSTAMIVFGVLMSPGVFRLVRASVVAVREELYVDAARVSGLSDARIMRRHILPVVAAPTIIQAAQMFGIAIMIQAGLQFLGIGSSAESSWGSMLSDAFSNIYVAPQLLVWPGLALTITVSAFALLGNALRDSLGATAIKPSRAARRKARAAKSAARVTPSAKTPAIVLSDDAASDDDDAAADAATPEADVLLVVENLRVAYPTSGGESVVVDGISLTVRKGEVVGLVGESGSGKTQTAFSILGLLPPEAQVTAHTISFDGRQIAGLGRNAMNELRGRRIGYVPQEPMSNLDPSFRIGFQLVEPMRQHLGLSKAQAKAKALGLLARVGINDPERTFAAYPHEISGGMAQRVLIAGAVSCDPELLIADEPTTALDVTVQAEVLDLMRSLQAEREMGMILVTHNFGVVADICDRVAVMQTGKIVETAPARELFANPQHPYTRMLLDSTLEDSVPRRALAAVGAAATGSTAADTTLATDPTTPTGESA